MHTLEYLKSRGRLLCVRWVIWVFFRFKKGDMHFKKYCPIISKLLFNIKKKRDADIEATIYGDLAGMSNNAAPAASAAPALVRVCRSTCNFHYTD